MIARFSGSFVLVALVFGQVACGDDDGPPIDSRDLGASEEDSSRAMDAGPIDAALVDGGATDAALSDDASSAMDAGAIDAAVTDAGPAIDATTSDMGDQPVDPATGLAGVWEVVGVDDSGGGREDVPPGTFYVFDATTVKLSCSAPSGLPYELRRGPAGFTVIHVELGSGSAVDWVIEELTARTLVFVEGGDRFFHERREACP